MTTKQTLIDLAKDTPLPAVAGLQFLGFAVADWILVLTLLWAAWRLVDGALRTLWAWQDRRAKRAQEKEDGSK